MTPLVHLQRLEAHGNKIKDVKDLPELENLEVLYLQDFEMTSPNPICSQSTYKAQVYKIYPKLVALDGYRKAVGEIVSMKDALPEIRDENISYRVEHEQWFDSKALEDPNPEKGKFEHTSDLKREENILQNLLNEC